MDHTADAIHRNRHAVAGIGGVVAFLLFWFRADWGFFWGLIAGLVVYGLLLLVITLIGRSDAVSKPDMETPAWRSTGTTGGGAAASGGGAAGATSPAVTGTPVGQGAAPGTSTTSREAAPGPAVVDASAAMPAPVVVEPPATAGREPRDVAPPPEGSSLDRERNDDAAMPLATAHPEAVAEAGPERAGQRPPTLDAPRGEGADDLTRIRGIGPKLEALCNRLGFWHFDQIAAWSEAEVDWVDQHLEGFRGRVRRDDWVAQARALADGRSDGNVPV